MRNSVQKTKDTGKRLASKVSGTGFCLLLAVTSLFAAPVAMVLGAPVALGVALYANSLLSALLAIEIHVGREERNPCKATAPWYHTTKDGMTKTQSASLAITNDNRFRQTKNNGGVRFVDKPKKSLTEFRVASRRQYEDQKGYARPEYGRSRFDQACEDADNARIEGVSAMVHADQKTKQDENRSTKSPSVGETRRYGVVHARVRRFWPSKHQRTPRPGGVGLV